MGNSKEHIFRKKTLETLGYLKSPCKLQVIDNNGDYRVLPIVGDTFVARGICQECNGGDWWQTIDNNAEHLKVSLARGTKRLDDLSTDERKWLAIWTVKAVYAAIAMRLDPLHNLVDPGMLHNFYKNPTMPENSAVFIMEGDIFEGEESLGYSASGFWVVTPAPFRLKYLSDLPRMPGVKGAFRLGRLRLGFLQCTEPHFELAVSSAPLFRIVESNGPVRRRSELYAIDDERLPLTSLNMLMCNLTCQHRDLLPPYLLYGERQNVMYTEIPKSLTRPARFQWLTNGF